MKFLPTVQDDEDQQDPDERWDPDSDMEIEDRCVKFICFACFHILTSLFDTSILGLHIVVLFGAVLYLFETE